MLLKRKGCLVKRTKICRKKIFIKRHYEFYIGGGRSSVSGIIATVFGSTGFLARYVIQRLGRVGSQVVAPYRGESKWINHLKPMGDLGQIVPVTGFDIRNREYIRNAVKNSNVVINLLGARYDTRHYKLEEVHIEAAKLIAQAAKEVNVARYVHVSALGADVNSPSRWSRSKALGEEAVLKIFPEATIIRPSVMYGHEDYFLRFLGSMTRFWPVYVLIHGDKKVQPIYVDNVAEAIINSLTLPNTRGSIYELGGPKVYTMREVAEWLKEILRYDKRIVQLPKQLEEDMVKILSMHRIPRITTEEYKDVSDRVVSEGAKKLSDLLVLKPSPMEREGFPGILHFRRPVKFDELLPEDKAELEREEKLFLGEKNPY